MFMIAIKIKKDADLIFKLNNTDLKSKLKKGNHRVY